MAASPVAPRFLGLTRHSRGRPNHGDVAAAAIAARRLIRGSDLARTRAKAGAANSGGGRKRGGRASDQRPNPLDAAEFAEHLREDAPRRPPAKGKIDWATLYREWRARLDELLARIHKRGRERLTIMVIPHTEQKILNVHVSIYTISIVAAGAALGLVLSMVSLVGKSGEDIQYYDMGLTNSQFNLQSVKMAEEMLPLHEIINDYANTISELYVKLDGEELARSGEGGAAQAVIDTEIADLRRLVAECKAQGEACSQELTEDILRRVIFLSRQDNHNLRRAVEVSEKILTELGAREKQNLLRNTPGIWPTRGYLMSPYGMQVDPIEGRQRFQRGIAIGALPGAEVVATAPGEVIDVSYDGDYGLQIRVSHRYGIKTFYAHLDRVRVKKGDQVSRGQVIGAVGKTGAAPVFMLYYEVHVGTVAYNPHAFLNHLQDQWLIQPRT